MSLSPRDTALALVAFAIVAVATVSALRARSGEVRTLIKIIVAMGFTTVVLGAAQVTSNGQLLDFHSSGHRANVIGLFANRNHAAMFIAGCIPLFVHLIYTWSTRPILRHVAAAAGIVVLLVGLIGTTSRAGFVLAALAGLYTLALSIQMVPLRNIGKWTILGGIVALCGLLSILLTDRASELLVRFGSASEDLRWGIWAVSLDAVKVYWPVGSGFGTFVPVYAMVEPLDMLSPQYVNNAHNDYIEVALEAGLLGVGVVVALLGLLLRASIAILRDRESRSILSMRAAALAFPWLVTLHSLVDYPARRMAIAVPLAVLTAIVLKRGLREGFKHPVARQVTSRQVN